MTNKKRGLSLVSVLLASLFSVLIIGGTVTFARFYGDYEKKNEVRVAGAVAKLQTDSIYRTDTEGTRISVSFDPTSDSAVIKDVEPEDVIDYYFTVTGADGKKENEVSLNVTVCVSVRLEMISSGKTGVETYYFAGWADYTGDGVRSGASLQLYHGAEGENQTDIRPSKDGGEEVDYTGNRLAVTVGDDGVTVNKTGLVMAADDGKKDYAYHLRFKLPEQSKVTESYAGAKVYFDISILAEQAQN